MSARRPFLLLAAASLGLSLGVGAGTAHAEMCDAYRLTLEPNAPR